MTIVFRNAPLLEIIAELRWPAAMQDHSKVDAFLMAFGGEVYQQGFQKSERIVPFGFPMVPNQVVYRYRKKDSTSEIFQAGPGVFSANAIPPYRGWPDFKPVVTTGLGALLNARENRAQPFSAVSLRYINGFRPQHMNALKPVDFMHEVLGFHAQLPPVITNNKVEVTREAVQATFRFENSISLAISLAEGAVQNESALLLDMTAALPGEREADPQNILDGLEEAHTVIHNIFFEMTAPIRELLQPEEI